MKNKLKTINKKTPLYLISLLSFFILFSVKPLYAGLVIDITEGVEGALPIAIVPFAKPATNINLTDIAAVVRADLRRSGLFSPLAVNQLPALPSIYGTTLISAIGLRFNFFFMVFLLFNTIKIYD